MTPALLTLLLTGPADVRPCPTLAQWWDEHLARQAAWPQALEGSIAGGFLADRVAWAFASAYQHALRVLVPQLPPDSVTALCVTEAQGTSPKAMQTTLGDDGHGGLRLSGAKHWATLGPQGARLLVAARDARQAGERPVIRLVELPSGTAGVQLQALPPTAFVPELPHARLRLDQVAVPADALLPGDGYAQYVKPFRSIEDLHVQAAVLAYLLRESRRLAWPRSWTERALATLLAFCALAGLAPDQPSTHVALAGAMAAAAQLADESEAYWKAAPDSGAAARWQRDRKLLTLASQARKARLETAWNQLSA